MLDECDIVINRTYHTKACQQSMMETFRTFCTIDTYGRLHVVSSTQIVFHCRRIISHALGISPSKIRVTKPRIGGGFGAKQTSVSEIYPAFVTWKTKKPSKIIFSREETQSASSPRHEMQMHVRLGATKDGIVKGIDLYTLSNTGAYGEHGPTTVGLSGHKSIPLYGKAEAFRFVSDVVYTNIMSAGAYRGYGATQGLFAVESAVNELADRLHMDPFEIRFKNIVKEGDVMPAYYGQVNTSCALDRCLAKVKEMIKWDEKYPMRKISDTKARFVGMGMAMQGSGISGVDVGSATPKLNDEGVYTMNIGAADMGTGCDTILAQIAAAEVEVDLLTGESRVVEYDACVDCGTPVNPNLARVQAEGGILQGIGMTMSENITYSDKGKLYENSFLQYKIPSRMDIGRINVEFESSYENAGPFGAKSIGEVVINTPLPAITDALSHAAGKRFYELPITPDQIAMASVKDN